MAGIAASERPDAPPTGRQGRALLCRASQDQALAGIAVHRGGERKLSLDRWVSPVLALHNTRTDLTLAQQDDPTIGHGGLLTLAAGSGVLARLQAEVAAVAQTFRHMASLGRAALSTPIRMLRPSAHANGLFDPVIAAVIDTAHQHEILWPIIRFVVVDMVDQFALLDRTADLVSHDLSVLSDVPVIVSVRMIRHPQEAVAATHDDAALPVPSTLAAWLSSAHDSAQVDVLARRRAVVPFANLARLAVEDRPADVARNLLSQAPRRVLTCLRAIERPLLTVLIPPRDRLPTVIARRFDCRHADALHMSECQRQYSTTVMDTAA